MAKKPDPKAAADRAEARSKSKPVAAKKPSAVAAAKPAPRIDNPELDQEEKALFLNHMPKVRTAKEAVATATANLRNLYKKAKAEGGFEKADFDYAFALETSEKEAKERAKIIRQLKIAKIVGSSLGAQLDMFSEPDRTPASDIAFEEGERDAMQNLAAKPKYDPSTEQHRKYLEGYHGVSEKRVKDGIGKLDPEATKLAEKHAAEAVKIDTQKAKDAKAFEEPESKPAPTSGVPMTRAQFRKQQEEAKVAG